MALFTESQLRSIGRSRSSRAGYIRADSVIVNENSVLAKRRASFDVFLSHSIADSEIILGVKTILESKGLSVYVDWIEDPDLHRSDVTAKTASRLRERMRQSSSMVYAHSTNSPSSKWMPWELGFFDGFSGAITIFPIARSSDGTYEGQEFLGLYPYIDYVGELTMFVNKGTAPARTLGKFREYDSFRSLKDWMNERAGVVMR